jgi:hypothetical protein
MPAPKVKEENGKRNRREPSLALGERSEKMLARRKRRKGSGTSEPVSGFAEKL